MNMFWLFIVIVASFLLGIMAGIMLYCWSLIMCSNSKFFGFCEKLLKARIRFRTGLSEEEVEAEFRKNKNGD